MEHSSFFIVLFSQIKEVQSKPSQVGHFVYNNKQSAWKNQSTKNSTYPLQGFTQTNIVKTEINGFLF